MLNFNIVHLSSSFSGTDKMSVFSFKDILFEFISTVLEEGGSYKEQARPDRACHDFISLQINHFK
jgi:hypothetical protein